MHVLKYCFSEFSEPVLYDISSKQYFSILASMSIKQHHDARKRLAQPQAWLYIRYRKRLVRVCNKAKPAILPKRHAWQARPLSTCILTRFCLIIICECCRQGSKMYFHLPPQEIPLSVMFERMELAKSQLNILEYALSQTTLEQVSSCERHSYAECAI